MPGTALSEMGIALVVALSLIVSGCSSTVNTKPSSVVGNTARIDMQKAQEESVRLPVKYTLISATRTKDIQPFRHYINRPVESKDPGEGQSFLIIDLTYTNPNSSRVSESIRQKDFELLIDGNVSPSVAYEWHGIGKAQFDARNMSMIKSSAGYWSKISSGENYVSGHETRTMQILFEIPDNSGEPIVLRIKGEGHSLK